MRVHVLDWQPAIMSNPASSLRGYVKVQVGGLIFHGTAVGISHGKAWAMLASKPRVGRGGNLMQDDAGKLLYSPVVEWANADIRRRFSAAVINALLTDYPDALQGVEP
jgi:hypothetical protein